MIDHSVGAAGKVELGGHGPSQKDVCAHRAFGCTLHPALHQPLCDVLSCKREKQQLLHGRDGA